jgi:GAF domain-containing protein
MIELEPVSELAALQHALDEHGLHAALAYLNSRTPFRFTGVYRFDAATLRNLCLFDRWSPDSTQGEDAPLPETFCAIVRRHPEGLEVDDGRTDERFPWMADNPVVCYCGTLLRGEDGVPYGTLCHFDVQRCQRSQQELALLQAAAPLVSRYLAASGRGAPAPAAHPAPPAW